MPFTVWFLRAAQVNSLNRMNMRGNSNRNVFGWSISVSGLADSMHTLFSRSGLCAYLDTHDPYSPSRVVSRDGKVQISLDQISLGKKKRYWRNPLTTLLDLKWRWIIVIFAVGFIFTWLLFGVIYYLIAKVHGDLMAGQDLDHEPCMYGVDSFTSAFLFSLETQHTIGYGSRNPTSECKEVVFLVFLQYVIGVAVQCVTAGVVVAKLQTGKRVSNSISFSKVAVVGKCDGEVCVMVRVGNSGKSELVNAKGFGVLIERQKLKSGEEILSESLLEFTSENGSESLDLLWPVVLHCSILDKQKALIKRLKSRNTELVVTVEGVLASTGQTLQLRTSYLSHEIEIGKQFVDISPRLVTDMAGKGYSYHVDYSDFNATISDEKWESKLWDVKNNV